MSGIALVRLLGVFTAGATVFLLASSANAALGLFPATLSENQVPVDDTVFTGPPDDTFAGIAGDAVTYDFDGYTLDDGDGQDFVVYEVDFGGAEFGNIDVLVSENGIDFVSVKDSEGAKIDLEGAEAHQSFWLAKSYDVKGSGYTSVRYVRIQGKGFGTSGGTNGFDLDAIGAIHYSLVPEDPSEGACPLTPGYWKNHADAWAIDELALGNHTYDQGALLDILHRKPKGGNMLVKLAHMVIAVELSAANGSELSEEVEDALASAHALIGDLDPGTDFVKASSDAGQAMEGPKDVLDDYLNDDDACEDDEDDDGGNNAEVDDDPDDFSGQNTAACTASVSAEPSTPWLLGLVLLAFARRRRQ